MGKIKLLLIAPSFYPIHGGAGLRFFRYLPLLYENNVYVTIICGTPKSKKFTEEDRKAEWLEYQDGVLVVEEHLENAKILKYKIPGKGVKRRSRILLEKAIDCFSEQATKPDIVHIIAPMPFQVIKQLKKMKNLGVKLIYSHTIVKDFSKNAFVRLMQKWKIKQVYMQYDHILVQSNELKDVIEEINSNSEVTVITNGVDTEKFSPVRNQEEKNQLRDRLGLPADATIITLVGAVHPRKGTDLLIEAWSYLVKDFPDLHVLLIGPRYDKIRDELKEFSNKIETIINNSERSDQIHFLGQIDEVAQYLKATDIFVFPSKREGMPNAVLEAMATGLPVILTPFSGLSDEFGQNNREYILVERSCEAVTSGISSVLKDNILFNTLAKKGREHVMDTMSISLSVQLHTDLYENC